MERLSDLRGIGQRRLKALESAGICTLADLLMTLPAGYRDTSVITPLTDLREGVPACVQGTLKAAPKLSRFHSITRVTATLTDAAGALPLIWYNQPWMMEQLPVDTPLLLYGKVERDKRGKRVMNNPRRELEQALLPVYAPLSGVPGKVFGDIVCQAMPELDACCPETLPESIRLKYHLCERNFALRQAHRPDGRESLAIAQRRIAFERLLLYQAAIGILRGAPGAATALPADEDTLARFWRALPYRPTKAQSRVLREIAGDLARSTAMRRMVQGDVGSGKTALAFGALYIAAQCGRQGALMAPTEILARQHLESAKKILEPLGVSCGLLLGGMKAKERREALFAIEEGRWQAVIGTHALLSEGVQYKDLSLVVTDEQHRFGVRQRQLLSQKAASGREPHVLVMSATPIPRTLSLVLYGDLELSAVDEMPPGRTPVKTRIVPESKRDGLYQFILSEAKKGRQAYIVCPLVEDSEVADAQSAKEVHAALTNGPLSALRLGLTYGEQEADEKARTLAAFSSGEIDVLVATTVIEVGVNVPNATVMVIENADRFGLSQLHQLRGRVGRGAEESWCFLMADPNDRLRALCETNDGFEIARKDLELRGPGELLGTRQHGAGMFAGMEMDAFLIQETQKCMRALERGEGGREALQAVQSSARQLFQSLLSQIALN